MYAMPDELLQHYSFPTGHQSQYWQGPLQHGWEERGTEGNTPGWDEAQERKEGSTGHFESSTWNTTPDNHSVQYSRVPGGTRQTPALAAPTDIYAYCFDRGNGTYTRLIPADMLPPLQGIAPRQRGREGMLILPLPQRLPPQGALGSIQSVAVKATLPSSHSEPDTVQEQIDNIIASSPATPKKTKVYCDKWVHEGVCAFTQQGCKYKHEMPMDKATQQTLGLFHGLPAWWKKHQTELQRHQAPGPGVSGSGNDAYRPYHEAPFGANENVSDTTTAMEAQAAGRERASTLPSSPAPQQARPWTRQLKHSSAPVWAPAGTHEKMNPLPEKSWTALEGRQLCHTAQPPTSYEKGTNRGAYSSAADSLAAIGGLQQVQRSVPTSPCIWGPIGPPVRYMDVTNTSEYDSQDWDGNGGRGGTRVEDHMTSSMGLLSLHESRNNNRRLGAEATGSQDQKQPRVQGSQQLAGFVNLRLE